MSYCKHGKRTLCGICDAKGVALSDARNAVIEAAKIWATANGPIGSAHHELKILAIAVADLRKLEQPPDPLEPVREFVRFCFVSERRNSLSFDVRLEAAAKALGMEDK